MPNSAVVRITQFLPDSYYRYVSMSDLSSVGSIVEQQTSGSNEGSMGFQLLPAIQNPKPVQGQEGIVTDNPEDWSDSPTLAPTLNDWKRYAYGRGDSRYGRLDQYHGVIIEQKDFSREGDYSIEEYQTNMELLLTSLEKNITGEILIEDHERASGEVTVYQYDLVVYASPVPYSYKNPIDTDVSIRLSNYIYPLNSSTITLSLNGETKTGLTVTPFSGGLGGFDALWTNNQDFDYNETVWVEWRVYDTADPANEVVIKYWFRTVRDLTGPRLSSQSPQDDETDVSVDSCIQFTLRDYEHGVNINSLEFYVNNVLIQNSECTIAEISTSDGYSISYCPNKDFLYGDEIPVSIYVEDNSEDKNYSFFVYSFTTEYSDEPRLVGEDPTPCTGYHPINKNISVDIVDGGHGVDSTSIILGVGDETVNPRKAPIIYRED